MNRPALHFITVSMNGDDPTLPSMHQRPLIYKVANTQGTYVKSTVPFCANDATICSFLAIPEIIRLHLTRHRV